METAFHDPSKTIKTLSRIHHQKGIEFQLNYNFRQKNKSYVGSSMIAPELEICYDSEKLNKRKAFPSKSLVHNSVSSVQTNYNLMEDDNKYI